MATASVRSTFTPFDAAVLGGLSLMWGMSFLFIKVAVEDLAPIWVVAGRTGIGACVLLIILAARRRQLPRRRVVWGHLLFLGLTANMLPWLLLAWAEQEIDSGLASVINALTPSMTMVIALAVGLERLTGRRLAGLALALGGTVLAVAHELGQPGRTPAVLAVVVATALYGTGAVYAKRNLSGTLSPLPVATGQVLLSAVVTTVAALAFEGIPTGVGAPAIGSIVGLGVLGTGLAFLAFYILLERVGATSSVMVTYLIPIVGLTAGALLLDERIGPNIVAGLVAIVAGIWLAQREVVTAPLEQIEELHP